MLDIEPDPHCQAVFDIMPGPLRSTSWWSQRRDLLTLLQKFGNSEASDPRDKIYALLGISSNRAEMTRLLPDYAKSLSQLTTDATLLIYGAHISPFRSMESLLRSIMYLPHESFHVIASRTTFGEETQRVEFLIEWEAAFKSPIFPGWETSFPTL